LVTFAAVGASGSTSVTTSATGPVLPTGFSAGSPSAYYSLSTTAAFSGGATVCVSYADTTFQDDSRLDLLQRSGNQWTVITTTRDAIAKRVCGRAAALSTFVVAANLQTATTTFLGASGSTGVLQPVSLYAYVVATASGTPVNTGTMRFMDGSTVVAVSAIGNGFGYALINGLTPGSHSLTAVYDANAAFAGSVSDPFIFTVSPPEASTFTLLVPATNPQAAGQPAVLIAAVLPLAGGGVPTGSVNFYENNSISLGSAPLVNGFAVFSTVALPTGLHYVSAVYGGSGSFRASYSMPILQTIYSGARPAATSLTVSAAPNPAHLGDPITLTATMTAGGAPFTTVAFFVDSILVGGGALTNVAGTLQASMTLTFPLAAGTHLITASYVGSTGFASGNSPIATMVIESP